MGDWKITDCIDKNSIRGVSGDDSETSMHEAITVFCRNDYFYFRNPMNVLEELLGHTKSLAEEHVLGAPGVLGEGSTRHVNGTTTRVWWFAKSAEAAVKCAKNFNFP